MDVSDRNSMFKGKKVQALAPKVEEVEEGNTYGQEKVVKKTKKRKKAKADDSKRSINHITDVFAKFHKVKLTTPLMVGQLGDTLAALQAKLEEFKAWKPVEASDEPPAHVLEAEEKARSKARRGSITMADTEQVGPHTHTFSSFWFIHSHWSRSIKPSHSFVFFSTPCFFHHQKRRVQEHNELEEEVAEESRRHRRNSQQMAMAMADAEQARRIAEHADTEHNDLKVTPPNARK